MSDRWKTRDILNAPITGGGTDLFDILYDAPASGRNFTKPLNTQVDPDMYEVAVQLVHHPDLPFSGSISMMGRHVWAAGLIAMQEFLEAGGTTLLKRFKEAQQRSTMELLILQYENNMNDQVDILRAHTVARSWEDVNRVLALEAKFIDDLPHRSWRTRVAEAWLKHAGVKGLMRNWEVTMREESPVVWDKMRDIFVHWEAVVGVL